MGVVSDDVGNADSAGIVSVAWLTDAGPRGDTGQGRTENEIGETRCFGTVRVA